VHFLIPCVFYAQIFYSDFFLPFDKSSSKISGDSANKVTSKKEIQISASIARGLLVNFDQYICSYHFAFQYLVDVIIGYLSSQDQWELLRSTILTILQHDCCKEGMLNIDSRVCSSYVKHAWLFVTIFAGVGQI